MNMIICRHPGTSVNYLFKVPENAELDVGTLVTVETSRGVQPAQCVTSSFRADPEVICEMWGTVPGKMKRVVSFMVQSYLDWPEHKPEETKDIDDEP